MSCNGAQHILRIFPFHRELHPGDREEAPINFDRPADEGVPEADVPEMPDDTPEEQRVMSFRVTKKDIDDNGPTPGCPGG